MKKSGAFFQFFSIFVLILNAQCSNFEKRQTISISHPERNLGGMARKRPRFVWLESGELVKAQTLQEDGFKKLLKEKAGTYSQELSKSDNFLSYILDDGTIAVVSRKSHFVRYFSSDDVKKILQDKLSEGLQLRPMLLNKNPYGKDFPLYTKHLCRELAQVLNLNYTEPLSKSFLKLIDDKINKKNDDDAYRFRYNYFINLIAIVGEVYSNDYHNYNVNWYMDLSELDSKTWSPYIQIEGNFIEFASYLKEDMFAEKGPEYPLSEAYETITAITKTNLRIN